MTGPDGSTKRFLSYGKRRIAYGLLFVDRKTVEIAVHPDSTVVVKAPVGSDFSQIEKKVEKRARWIIRQLKYFEQFSPRTPERCYVAGESHLYLGKKYRLKIERGKENSLKLINGTFLACCRGEPDPERIKSLMERWYLEKAKVQFNDSLARCWPRMKNYNVVEPGMSVRRMKTRWGSLSRKGNLTLNTELVKVPRECIDYVVMHELCHLIFHDHSPEFYRLLDSVIPGWERIKHKLELSMT